MRSWIQERKKLAEEILHIILSKNVLRSGNYVLHLGKKTKRYIDLRLIPSFPLSFKKVCDAYCMMMKNEIPKVEKIVGVPTASLPFTSVVSLKLNVPHIYVEKTETYNSFRHPISGVLNKGEHVILLDDVSASGITLLCVTSVLRVLGGIVRDAFVLVDRQEGAEEILKEAGVNLHYLLTLEELIAEE